MGGPGRGGRGGPGGDFRRSGSAGAFGGGRGECSVALLQDNARVAVATANASIFPCSILPCCGPRA